MNWQNFSFQSLNSTENSELWKTVKNHQKNWFFKNLYFSPLWDEWASKNNNPSSWKFILKTAKKGKNQLLESFAELPKLESFPDKNGSMKQEKKTFSEKKFFSKIANLRCLY